MLTFQQRRENLKRLSDSPRRDREVTAVACAELGLTYGALEVPDAQAEAYLTVRDGFLGKSTVAVAWGVTDNRSLLVHRGA